IDKITANGNYTHVVTDALIKMDTSEGPMQIPRGSVLWFLQHKQSELALHGNYWDTAAVKPSAELVIQLTADWLNAPYLWGGRTILGVDCSGFAQTIFRLMGIQLPRDAWQQAQFGQTVRKLKESVCGDLAFFNDREEIVHVGILLGGGRIIHSSGKVRIDQIDKKGIINTDTGKYSHYLRVIKRCW
ncbi:MAG: NlpC/P60 family protein, partial [Chitinophagaceae bacterium]